MSRELMKLALEELQNARDHIYLLPENEQPLTEEQILNRINAAITVLHQEVYGTAPTTQPEQEPVAMYEDWYNPNSCGHCGMVGGHTKICRHYTTPPQRKPLTEKRIEELYSFWVVDCQDIVGFARAVERTVKGEV